MLPKRTRTDWALLLTLVLMWGTSFLFTKVAVESVPPTTLVAVRVGISACILTPLCRAAGLHLPAAGSVWWRFLTLAVIGNALPFFLISWGQERIDSGLAGILMAIMPLATLALAHFLVAGERVTAGKATGFLLGFGGIVVLTGSAALGSFGDADNLGRQGAVLAGALCYAINTILARRLPPMQSLVVATAVMIVAATFMVPIAIAIDAPWGVGASSTSIAAAVWLGVVSTAAATVVYFKLIASAGPTFLSLINYMIPLVAVVVGTVLLGEQLHPRAMAALALILLGVALGQGAGRKAEK